MKVWVVMKAVYGKDEDAFWVDSIWTSIDLAQERVKTMNMISEARIGYYIDNFNGMILDNSKLI